jgi:signal-transduction protein with cAMP-binding, CBS, and nucleotidyltransferase domain
MVSSVEQNRLARKIREMNFEKDQVIKDNTSQELFLIVDDEVEIEAKNKPIETLYAGDFFGKGEVLDQVEPKFIAKATQCAKIYAIPGQVLATKCQLFNGKC